MTCSEVRVQPIETLRSSGPNDERLDLPPPVRLRRRNGVRMTQTGDLNEDHLHGVLKPSMMTTRAIDLLTLNPRIQRADGRHGYKPRLVSDVAIGHGG